MVLVLPIESSQTHKTANYYPILPMSKLRLREGKCLSQSHTAGSGRAET